MFSSQISEIIGSLPTSSSFTYGTAKEINYKIDTETNQQDFYVCLFPFSPIGISLLKTGGADNEFDIYMEFLFKTKFERTSADNEQATQTALYYANLFLVRLREYQPAGNQTKYFNWRDTDKATARPVYNMYDVNTCGISLTFKLRLMNPPLGQIC